MTDEELKIIFDLLDVDKSGNISLQELRTFAERSQKRPSKKEEEEGIDIAIDEIWRQLDKDNSGFLEVDEIIQFIKDYMGETVTEEEAKLFIKENDTNSDGKIDEYEFAKFIEKFS